VLQPTLHDEGSKPLTPAEIASGQGSPLWDAAIRRGYPELRAAAPELARRGVHFADLSRAFAELSESTYIDGCHFQGAGMALFGEKIVDALLAALPATLPPPLTPAEHGARDGARKER
jgi:lysophospholipase L1-like esterase